MQNEKYITPERFFSGITLEKFKKEIRDNDFRKELLLNSKRIIGSPYCESNEPLWRRCLLNQTHNQISCGTSLLVVYYLEKPRDNFSKGKVHKIFTETGVFIQKPSIIRFPSDIQKDPQYTDFEVRKSENTTLLYSTAFDAIVVGGAPEKTTDTISFGRIWYARQETQLLAIEQLIIAAASCGTSVEQLEEHKKSLINGTSWVSAHI